MDILTQIDINVYIFLPLCMFVNELWYSNGTVIVNL